MQEIPDIFSPILPFFTEDSPATIALNAVREGIILLNHDAKVLFYNKAQLDFDGLTLDEVSGRYPWEIYAMRTDMSTLWQVLNTGKPVNNFVQYYCRKNGKYARVRGNSHPIHMGGRLVGALAVYHEMSDTGNKAIKILRMNQGSGISSGPSGMGSTGTPCSMKPDARSDNTHRLYTFQDMISEDPAFQNAVIQAEKAAATHSPVMLFGETGTGKEMFSQSIHSAGTSKNRPFTALNCAAVPENLIEGILFGTRKGVYTGATERKGLFAEADGGTFFLDEINSMPPQAQGKLLRVLEEKRIRPLGSREEIPVNVRIISSCNSGYESLIQETDFRSDLFYRLAVVTIHIPPLRDRVGDIPTLLNFFIRKFNHDFGKTVSGASGGYLKGLLSYRWPGNVRQLKHCVESSMNMISDNHHLLNEEHLPEYLKRSDALGKGTSKPHMLEQGYFEASADHTVSAVSGIHEEVQALPEPATPIPTGRALSAVIDDNEKRTIVSALLQSRGNVSRAAKSLGMSRGALYYRLKKYGIR